MSWVEEKTGIDVTFDTGVDFIDDLADDIGDLGGDVLGEAVDVIEDVFDGVGDFVGQIGEAAIDVAASPVGQIALQLIPVTAPYAKYITAAAKVAKGQDLTAADFVSLGIQGMSDFDTGITVPDAVKTAAKVGARISDGADPIQVLIGEYGDDFLETTGLGDSIKETVGNVVGEDAMSWVTENMDLNQAASDLIAGEQPLRLLSNQFGDQLVNSVASDDPNIKALGYAGLRTAIGLDEGLDADQALLRGAEEYYDRGGRVNDLLDLPDSLGTNFGIDLNLDLTTPEWAKDLYANLPDLDFSGINWSVLGDSLPEINANFKGIDLGSLNWEGLDWNVFDDYSLPELEGMGVNLESIQLPEVATALQAFQQQQRPYKPYKSDEEEIDLLGQKRTTDNELLPEKTPLSQELLQRTFTLG
jgi:hypothetical protein